MKVLVVDDSAIMRRILTNILEEKDVKKDDIIDAADGKEALEILNKESEIGLVLLDWNMPRLNGLDFVKLVRKIDAFKSLPIIMVTSEAAKYNVMEAIKAGVTDYLMKPISGAKLLPKLTEHLK